MFGGDFWHRACIVLTHFSQSPQKKAIRIQQGINKKENIRQSVREKFGVSFVEIFFMDAFDVG